MAYPINLYKNGSGVNHTNKNLISYGTVNCEFKNTVNVEKPIITISASDYYDDVDFIYIPQFGRYYYAHADAGRGAVITYNCESDPLMSFRAQLLNCPVVVSRNPWKYDMYIADPNLPVESRTVKSILKFPNNPFNGNFNSYILTTLGPGGDIVGGGSLNNPINGGE